MTDKPPMFVTQGKCSGHRRWMIGTLLIILGMGAVVVGLAYSKGDTAEKRAGEVDTRLQVHEGKQERDEQHLRETLVRIEDMQTRVFDKVVNGK